MASNGSPAPLFETEDDRLSFVIRWRWCRQRTPRKPQGKLPRANIISLATDDYSVWATVFRGDLATLAALASKYPGTRS